MLPLSYLLSGPQKDIIVMQCKLANKKYDSLFNFI